MVEDDWSMIDRPPFCRSNEHLRTMLWRSVQTTCHGLVCRMAWCCMSLRSTTTSITTPATLTTVILWTWVH